MKKQLTLIFVILITTIVCAQDNYQDVVYLKNGSVIRGVIVEQVPNESIKIETADKSIFVYAMEDIEKMTKEVKTVSLDPSQGDYMKNSGLKKGHRGIIEIGYQFGVGNYAEDRIKLNFINGGQINPYVFIGGGVGLRYYFDSDVVATPIFIHPRFNFTKGKISPYGAISLGYTLNASDDFAGLGLLVSPSTGVTFNVSEKVNLNVGLSYEMQAVKAYYGGSEKFGALSLDFGISF